MLHFRARAIGPLDLAILMASAALAVFVVVATDREYMTRFGRQPARVSKATRLPGWLKERRHEAIRLVHGGTAILATMGLGLGVVVLRRRVGTGCPGPFGPGSIAAILTGCVALALAIRWGFPRAIIRLSGTGVATTGRSDDLYSVWHLARPQVTWMILGAWCTLFATGRWRRPVDGADCLGRWLAVGWLILAAGQAAIYIIAWY